MLLNEDGHTEKERRLSLPVSNEVGTTVTSAIMGTLVNLSRSGGLNQLG